MIYRYPTKVRGELKYTRRVSSSWSTGGTRGISLVKNPAVSHKWGKGGIVITTKEPSSSSFVIQIFRIRFNPFCLGTGCIAPKALKTLFVFPIFWLWAYLMNVIPETSREHNTNQIFTFLFLTMASATSWKVILWCVISCYSIFSFMCVFCRLLFVLFLLVIVLSVLLRYTDSDYPFGIFKLFFYDSLFYIRYRTHILYISGLGC